MIDVEIFEPTDDLLQSETKTTTSENVCTKEEILKNVLNKCRIEADNDDLEIPVSRVVERVSNYTGLSIGSVTKMYNSENVTYQKISMELSNRIEIYKCLKDLYKKKIPPTYNNIYNELKKFIESLTLTELKMNMTLMGYSYYNMSSNIQILLEDPKIMFERYLYLKKMRIVCNTKGHTVYYIDERVIDTSLTFPKPWIANIDYTSPSWQGYIILHIISGKQCINSLYCNSLTEEDFKKWICDIVLKKLNPNSTIVMDNNKLHSTFDQKLLTKYDSRQVMLNWLKINNIPCSSNMHKAELYQLYKKTPKSHNDYDIDSILKAHGHDVLRLPSTWHDLSPTELFWDCIRSTYVTSINTTPSISVDELHTVQSRINSFLKKYNETSWIKFEKKIRAMENQLFELDADIDKVIDDFLSSD